MQLASLATTAAQATTRVIRDFPWVVLTAVIGTTCGLLTIETSGPIEDQFWKCLVTALIGLPLTFALTLWANRLPSALARRLVPGLGLLAATALAVWLLTAPDRLPGTEISRTLTLILAAHLAAALLPTLGLSALPFWRFNVALFLRYLLGLLYAVVLFGGLALGLLSCDRLLDLDIADRAYARLWFLIAGLFHPIFFLAGFDPRCPAPARALFDRPEPLRKFVLYVLVPLTSVYLAILYLYAARIALAAELPNGWVGLPVLLLTVFGLLASLLLHPWLDTAEGPAANRLIRGFHALTLPLTALLALSIGVRVAAYGITEPRYYVVLLTAWLALTCALGAWRPTLGLRWVPASLAVIALAGSLGPWGASGWSLRAQSARLDQLITTAELRAADGTLRPFDATRAAADFDSAPLLSTWEYLDTRHGEAALAPWLQAPYGGPSPMLAYLALPTSTGPNRIGHWSFAADPPPVLIVEGHPLVLYLELNIHRESITSNGWSFRLSESSLGITAPTGESRELSAALISSAESAPHHLAWPAFTLDFIITHASGSRLVTHYDLQHLGLLIALPAPAADPAK